MVKPNTIGVDYPAPMQKAPVPMPRQKISPRLDDQPRANRLIAVALGLIVLTLAAVLRFSYLNWDLAQWIHPDEGHMRAVTGAVQWPDTLASYFDTQASPLNPRNHDRVYSYGTLPLFATRAVTEWLDRACAPEPDRFPALVARLVLDNLGRSGAPSNRLCAPGTFTWTYNAFVGRHLSALADLGTVLLIGLLGHMLYGRRVGLPAMALAAVNAFMIQQAHFYTVDSAATFFTVLTGLCAVRAGKHPTDRPPWGWLALAGLSTGLATACKVSAAPAGGLAALGALWWAHRVGAPAPTTGPDADPDHPAPFTSGTENDRAGTISDTQSPPITIPTAVLRIVAPLLLAALLSLLAFRVGQPYAFEGPGFLGVRPNAAWFDRLAQISEEQSGVIDYPSGRQWTARLPLVFPMGNLIVWGMGLPLGLAALWGWAQSGWELVRGDQRHLVLWLWTTAYIAFYASRWVKAMRYFLPIYPFLIVIAAYTIQRHLSEAMRHHLERGAGIFTSPRASTACPPSEGRAPDDRHSRIWARVALTLIVLTGTTAWGLALFRIYLRPHTRIAASRWIYDNVLDGSVVANEHWDWGLPLRIDGKDAFSAGGPGPDLTQVTLELYNEDTPEKREQLIDWLNKADYLFLASNRLYGSISRMPERYPLTTEYYRALFAEELGFELVAEFTSYPEIGPFIFPDQENPYPLARPATATQRDGVRVPLPPAEESFSVYDHPDCLVFRKRADYSPADVSARLSQVDLTQAVTWQTPQEATPRTIHVAHHAVLYVGLALVATVAVLALIRCR